MPDQRFRSAMEKTRMTARIEYLEGTAFQKTRAFSPAVITEGGRMIWLARRARSCVRPR